MNVSSTDQEVVVNLEKLLLDQTVRASKVKLADLLDEEFLEVGASGKRYTKTDILTELPSEAAAEQDTVREMNSICVKSLASNLILLTYSCEVRKRSALSMMRVSWRSSIWRRHQNQWQLLFHQGTPTQQIR